MADIKELLKSKKIKEFKAKKRRPWDTPVQTVEKHSIEPTAKSGETSDVSSSPIKNKSKSPNLDVENIRKQNVNNTDTNVYVNNFAYVNNTETDRKQQLTSIDNISSDEYSLRKQSVNNADTDVYVNKFVYVNNTETNSRPNDSEFNISNSSISENQNKAADPSVYVNNTRTERKQNVNTETNLNEYVNSTLTNARTNTETERKQESIYKLSRVESQIFAFIMRLCVANGSKKTPSITYDQIATASSTTNASAKTLVARLINKGFLARVSFTKGPGSTTIYMVPDDSYQAFLFKNHSLVNFEIRNQNVNNTETSLQTSTRTELSSSSIYNKINTTTEECRTETVPEIWKQIKVPEILRTNGITETHAKQVLMDKDNVLSLEDVQESFENFATDLEHKVLNIKLSPVQFFMGILRKNRTKYESKFVADNLKNEIEAHFKSTQVKDESLKLKAQSELIEKFQKWADELTQDEKNTFAPPNQFVEEGSATQEIMLKSYFMKNFGFEV